YVQHRTWSHGLGRGRATKRINRRQAANFMEAPEFANELGRPLNCHVTIAFAHTDIEAAEVESVFRKIRDDRFKPWLAHRRRRDRAPQYGPPTFVWAQENGRDGQGNGFPHVHWLLHMPPALLHDFTIRVRCWVGEFGGNVDWSETVVKVDPATTPGGLRRYLLKDLSPRLREHFNIPARWPGTYGVVYGKRIGFSQNLGPT
ncbi:hypothetical protein BVRB_028930, partial [Beta vulgaris subsp. vulgaris]